MNTDLLQLNIPRLDSRAADFDARLEARLQRHSLSAGPVHEAVAEIIAAVRERGDGAVLEYSRRFDGIEADSVQALCVERGRLQQALAAQPAARRRALEHAAERIRHYHEKQKQDTWSYKEADGSVYGQKVTALQRVGLYVPGGKADYPSTMLMLGIPAKVAGVEEVIAVVPTAYRKDGMVFAAAALAGVERLFTIGGAQAVAALAYGTEAVPRVDMVAGPGNIYVTAAKQQVFGEVGIDMLAGPSELTVISDGSADPDWLAMDLFAQAEHDEEAQSILIATSESHIDAVAARMARLLPGMPRRDIIAASLDRRGLLVLVRDLSEAVALSDRIAPEHLQLAVAEPAALAARVHNAGAIFLGHHSAEALGDYCAGPSHVLPTSGTARFRSALGVYDFQKRTSIIHCSPEGSRVLAATAKKLADAEGLPAHAASAAYRL